MTQWSSRSSCTAKSDFLHARYLFLRILSYDFILPFPLSSRSFSFVNPVYIFFLTFNRSSKITTAVPIALCRRTRTALRPALTCLWVRPTTPPHHHTARAKIKIIRHKRGWSPHSLTILISLTIRSDHRTGNTTKSRLSRIPRAPN